MLKAIIIIFGLILLLAGYIEFKKIRWIFSRKKNNDEKINENMCKFKFKTLLNSGNEKIDFSNEQVYDDSEMQIKYIAFCNPPGKIQIIYENPDYVKRESI